MDRSAMVGENKKSPVPERVHAHTRARGCIPPLVRRWFAGGAHASATTSWNGKEKKTGLDGIPRRFRPLQLASTRIVVVVYTLPRSSGLSEPHRLALSCQSSIHTIISRRTWLLWALQAVTVLYLTQNSNVSSPSEARVFDFNIENKKDNAIQYYPHRLLISSKRKNPRHYLPLNFSINNKNHRYYIKIALS